MLRNNAKGESLMMEFVGVTLRDLHVQARHKFTDDEICFIGWNMLNMLESLHNSGFIH